MSSKRIPIIFEQADGTRLWDGDMPECDDPPARQVRTVNDADGTVMLSYKFKHFLAKPEDGAVYQQIGDYQPRPRTKPPLGVCPTDIWLWNRAKDLARAIHESMQAGREPLVWWSTELAKLLAERNESSNL